MKQPSITLDDRLAAAGFRPSGFDYMRIILSILVVTVHSVDATNRQLSTEIWHGPLRPFMAFILPMFFALSGFLVAGSFERCRTIISFVGLRLLRLVPALAVDTAIAALLLGPIFTTLPLHEYFASPDFHAYFLNIIGEIHYVLPGVFTTNPWPNTVNAQLWTLPYELICYLSVTIFAFLGIAQRPKLFLPMVILLNLYCVTRFIASGAEWTSVTVGGPVLVLCFLYGIAGYLYRKKIVWNSRLFALSIVVVFACLASNHVGDLLSPIAMAYVTVYLGLTQPQRNFMVTNGDYSYGVFLYGFPIQQAVVAVWGNGQHWLTNLAFALPITLGFAIFSWHCVEKPVLKLRKVLVKIEDFGIRCASRIPYGKFLVPALGVRKPVAAN